MRKNDRNDKCHPFHGWSSRLPYNVLSFASGVLETGVIAAGLNHGGLTIALALALAYQLGCLARKPAKLSLRGSVLALFSSIPLLIMVSSEDWGLLVSTFLASAGIQSAREWLLPQSQSFSIHTKRVVRVSGFVCGIFAGHLLGFIALGLMNSIAFLVVVTQATKQKKCSFTDFAGPWIADGHGWTMMFHQTHYFAYAYVLLAMFLKHSNGVPLPEWKTAATASLWFAFGWATYISGEWLLKKRLGLPDRKAAIAGHIWVFCCLSLLVIFPKNPAVSGIAWILGGFGGGSVYAIKAMAKETACRADIELWEHWGHIIGVALALVVALILPHTPEGPFFVALCAVAVTLLRLKGPTGEPHCLRSNPSRATPSS